MRMRQLFGVLMALLFSAPAFAVGTAVVPKAQSQMSKVDPALASMSVEAFLQLTPKKYAEFTGRTMSIEQIQTLKATQQSLRAEMLAQPKIDKTVYILLAIFGLGWLALGLLSDWEGNDWIVNLLLTMLCWIPGVIHALVVMKKYYK